MTSLDIHIRIIDDCVDHRLTLQFVYVLHALFLDLGDRLQTSRVLYICFDDGSGDEICQSQCYEEMLESYSAIQDVTHLHAKHLFHYLAWTLLLESFSGWYIHLSRISHLFYLFSFSSFDFFAHQTHLFFVIKHDVIILRDVVRINFWQKYFILFLHFDFT